MDTIHERTDDRAHARAGESTKDNLPAAVVLAGALIAGAIFLDGSSVSIGSARAPADNNRQPAAALAEVKSEGSPYLGRADAPLTIYEWADFQCPYCKQFETVSLPSVKKNYIDTGKVKIVFKDLAFLGPDSTTAALYNRAIWKLYPQQYGEWRAAMYEAQDEEHGGIGNAASIDALNAKITGINAAAVAADVAANRSAYEALINADREEGGKFGINATPSFIVGGQVISGAQPYEIFKEAIDAALDS